MEQNAKMASLKNILQETKQLVEGQQPYGAEIWSKLDNYLDGLDRDLYRIKTSASTFRSQYERHWWEIYPQAQYGSNHGNLLPFTRQQRSDLIDRAKELDKLLDQILGRNANPDRESDETSIASLNFRPGQDFRARDAYGQRPTVSVTMSVAIEGSSNYTPQISLGLEFDFKYPTYARPIQF